MLGAGGLLGSEIMKLLPDSVGLTRIQLSVTDLTAMNGALSHFQPELVFNCAAYNAVDGALDRPYLEKDDVGPLGVYGKSKLEGEKLMSMVMPRALIIRTAALFGGDGSLQRHNFPERILERARAGERLRVVSDQTVNPTYAADLAAAAIALASADMDGVVHVVSAGCSTWNELARATLAEFQVAGEVDAVSSSELSAPAPRPRNGCLESSRTQALRPWQEALAAWATTRGANEPTKA